MSRKEQELMRDIKRRWAIQCSEGELVCFLCGKKIDSMKQCNADHWMPKALGGKSTEENLKPAHKSCNSKKGCIHPNEFLLHRDEILANKYHPNEKKKSKETSKKEKKKKPQATIGDIIFYIHEITNDFGILDFEIKEGIVIGYNNKQPLVKDFYLTKDNKIESKLIAVNPLTKAQATYIMARYKKELSVLKQIQITR